MKPKLSWYWHRLRAMEAGEDVRHLARKVWQLADLSRQHRWNSQPFQSSEVFPRLPDPASAPQILTQCLRQEVADILAGRWRFFGHVELQVDDPPQWHKDYLADKDLYTEKSAFKLNHRELRGGADIKLIWEMNRWNQLVRLAQAAYLLNDRIAARKCIEWLQDWVIHNPAFQGWNWISALEGGLRLIQFAWIDALLRKSNLPSSVHSQLDQLGRAILPPHCYFTWRYRSFGSSANNHLLGELAGLIVAAVCWPAVQKLSKRLNGLQSRWEKEVLAQFAPDGGNREQALSYHLFSWELCWQAYAALRAAGKTVSTDVYDRLCRAARFYLEVQVRRDPWDYGDSDNAVVTPLFCSEASALAEWRDWIRGEQEPSGYRFWLGERPDITDAARPNTRTIGEWSIYPQTGIAIAEADLWRLRWDLSPLGYLKPAAHGHLDALHVSIWFKHIAVVVDPGTGSYYSDPGLRSWLASRPAHNGPIPTPRIPPKGGTPNGGPRRVGTFLWSGHHSPPKWKRLEQNGVEGLIAELRMPLVRLRRRIIRNTQSDGWDVFDEVAGLSSEFLVRWQFAPETSIKVLGERRWSINWRDVSIVVEVGPEWAEASLVESPLLPNLQRLDRREGVVSPAFRKTTFAPFLRLTARPGTEKPCLFRTSFLACMPS